MNSLCEFLTVTKMRHFMPLFYKLFHAFAIISTLLEYTLIISPVL